MLKAESWPGDNYQRATLVQYKTEEWGQPVDINALACFHGEWFEVLVQYQSEYQYFNSGACASLCPEMSTDPPSISSTVRSAVTEKSEPHTNLCIIPSSPPNVKYEVTHELKDESGEGYVALYLSYWCTRHLSLLGNPYTTCFNGVWDGEPPECVTDPLPLSVNFGSIVESWELDFSCYMPRQPKDGTYTVVNSPETKAGSRKSEAHLLYSCRADAQLIGNKDVYCIRGAWSSKSPTCVRCGHAHDATRPSAPPPWHAGVYEKHPGSHGRICGGAIVATNLIVSGELPLIRTVPRTRLWRSELSANGTMSRFNAP
ncbi:hypothetical protein EVAR_76167_1 [Eumeta japonica]|uniref:Sushi domain-containing protein n=1 Tax=Eumeta variegata TaxID=151549 RepID=A0A4C1UXX5_EUMVA|nr:hypothetical protein EVAR_76167_1 [Eumeta japonica]